MGGIRGMIYEGHGVELSRYLGETNRGFGSA